jgi:coniferyl-aldehyde dehydrogenase
VGGHGVPVGRQLADASQHVVPGPHSARVQKPPAPSGKIVASITALPSPCAAPSLVLGAIDEPHAALIAAKQRVSPTEGSPSFFMRSIVAHTVIVPTIARGHFSFGADRLRISGLVMTTSPSLNGHSSHHPETFRAELTARVERMRAAQNARVAPTVAERLADLKKLRAVLVSHKDDFARAINEDFGGRSRHETLLAEVFATLQDIDHTIEHLPSWALVEKRPVGMYFIPGRAEVRYQPKGVVGIISPWNYPLFLALSPLAGALAAGCRALIKPSELTPATSELLAKVIAEAFPSDRVFVVTGDAKVGEAFSSMPLDHLLFTGSTRVGRIVMRAAAENLVPVTLELGGKSPTIIHESFSIATAAARIMGGKLINAGQTCIAPDYVLVHESQRDAFLSEAQKCAAKMYPTIEHNADYTSVVNARHAARLKSYLDDARKKGARIIEINPANETLSPTRMAPTLVTDVHDGMEIMQEEIFGPLLPVVTYRSIDEAIEYVNARPRPLALYYFDNDKSRVESMLDRTVSGGASINECLVHVAQNDLPFGGVGPSGMGAYHGRTSFEVFSHAKGVFHQARVNSADLAMRPPYKAAMDMLLKVLTR